MAAWNIYARGRHSGDIYCHTVFAADAEHARTIWGAAYGALYEFQASEPEPGTPHGMDPDERLRHLLRAKRTELPEEGGDKEQVLLPEIHIDRAKHPFNADACMREVRVCSGGRDKTRS